jgi:hypothetical protein
LATDVARGLRRQAEADCHQMAVKEHIAYVPYAELARLFARSRPWTCVACGGGVAFRAFGHEPQPRRPLFECVACGRRSDGCQTFEGHHALYGICALSDPAASRCGHWLCSWQKAQGVCPVCGAARENMAESAAA